MNMHGRYTVLAKLDMHLAAAAPVDILHCVYLGLVRMEFRLLGVHLQGAGLFHQFREAWLAQKTPVPLPTPGEDGKRIFKKTLRADQLVSVEHVCWHTKRWNADDEVKHKDSVNRNVLKRTTTMWLLKSLQSPLLYLVCTVAS